ncbi:AcaB family transcriptional regulator [Vibrio sp. PNB22_3_1]
MSSKSEFFGAELDVDESIGFAQVIEKEHVPHRSGLKIRMYTNDCVRLLKSKKIKENGGEKEVFIPGLNWFERQMTDLMIAASNDDPFADQLLVDLNQELELLLARVRDQKVVIRDLIIDVFKSYDATLSLSRMSHCKEVSVFIENKLTVKLLWLIKEIDRLLMYVEQAEKHDIIKRSQSDNMRNDARKAFRNLIRMLYAYKPTSVTRKSMALSGHTKRIRKAIGDNKIKVTREVLMLERRAEFAPVIASRKHDNLSKKERDGLESLFSDVFNQTVHSQFDDDELAS